MNTLNKKAAVELSITTVVVIVVGVASLLLLLVLVGKIGKGAVENIDRINQKVTEQVNQLFQSETTRVVISLAGNEAQVEKGQTFGVAFSVKNTAQGESSPGNFVYTVRASNIQQGCQLSIPEADSYLILGNTGTFTLSPGEKLGQARLIRIQPGSTAPLCSIRYDLIVTKNGAPYESAFFDLKITS